MGNSAAADEHRCTPCPLQRCGGVQQSTLYSSCMFLYVKMVCDTTSHACRSHAVRAVPQARREPSRVAALYERAVAVFPVTHVLWAQYGRYLEAHSHAVRALLQARGEPSRVAALYERAVAVFPVTHVLWAQYGRYLEAHLRVPGVVSAVYARAVRNCPWVGALWARQGPACCASHPLDWF